MSPPSPSLADAALTLIGCPFRLHGRDPATGLDCVGVVSSALSLAGRQPIAPAGYSLRNLDVAQWLPLANASGLVPTDGTICAGDVLLVRQKHCQHHLMIAVDRESVVHAHAGLRRVVLQPLEPDWQIHAQWRAAPTSGV